MYGRVLRVGDRKSSKFTRVMRVEAPRQFLRNAPNEEYIYVNFISVLKKLFCRTTCQEARNRFSRPEI